VAGVASRFNYPPTPEISREVGARLQPHRRAPKVWQLALAPLSC
jgi:hypothetical protein